MTLGEKLQKLRKGRGWSQEKLAAEIHVSRQALSKWELGSAVPDTENVLQLARLFDVSTDYLLKDELETDERQPQPASPNPVPKKGIAAVIAGSTLAVISAAGLLIMGILSSLHPAHIDYASVVSGSGEVLERVVKTGLPAWLEINNLDWLFMLCLLTLAAGIVIALSPRFMPSLQQLCRRMKDWILE